MDIVVQIVYEFRKPVTLIIDPASNLELLLETIKFDDRVSELWQGSLMGPSRKIWSSEDSK